MKSYAETLESYLIPAEEGFIAGAAIVIGGFTVLNIIYGVASNLKLKNDIRRNGGNPAEYGNRTYRILKNYSNDITGVLEPVAAERYVSCYLKQLAIAKECDNIRKHFSSIDPTDARSEKEYLKINDRILELIKKATSINSEIKKIDLTTLIDTPIKLQNTHIEKLTKIEQEIGELCWSGGHDDGSFIMTEDFYFDEKSEDFRDSPHQFGNQCIDNFDKLVRQLTTDEYDIFDVTQNYIKKCKFAVNPNSKLAKKE